MKQIPVIFRHEIARYLSSSTAYAVVAIFLVGSGFLCFYVGDFLGRNNADLNSFFMFIPWLYLFLIPAISTHLLTCSNNNDSFELFMTLPITHFELIAGKFLAAWALTGVALLLTFPMVITANYLGTPDNQALSTAYFGSWLLAGGCLSIGCCMSALTRNNLITFTLTLLLLIIVSSLSLVLDELNYRAPVWFLESFTSLSFFTRAQTFGNGVVTLHDTLYFISLIFAWLAATAIVIKLKKD